MTFLHPIFAIEEQQRKFVAERLQALKAQLKADVLDRTDERSLRLATWNIMHFGDGGGYHRTPESMLYIAEILDHFDLVAIQEVNDDLTQFQVLVGRHLGPDWDYIVTDASGNRERLAFIFRKSKVRFQHEAGEIVLPTGQEIVAPDDRTATKKLQFARTPFALTFQSGWFRFKLATVHIFYGKSGDNTPEMELRRREIQKVAQFLADIQKKEKRLHGSNANMILLGDFNIVSPEHHTMKALNDAGFSTAPNMATAGTNITGNHNYDQIVFKLADDRVSYGASGVFEIFQSIYRADDAAQYIDVAKPPIFETNSDGEARTRDQKIAYYKSYYRKNQLSDHKLLWCEVKTDFSDQYLSDIAAGRDNRPTI